MNAVQARQPATPRGLRARPLRQAWADLSLRTKLLLFGLGLVTVPGGLFALVAFSGARAALEREVQLQLYQTAERGAEALATALERAQSDARSWASQDLMRDLMVGDLDKRVSRFLRTARDSKATYLDVLCLDVHGGVVAASDGRWIGHTVGDAARPTRESLAGPTTWPEFQRPVLEIAVPIANPDEPARHIGTLILIYDWGAGQEILANIRAKLSPLGKRVGAIVVDRAGRVIGGVAIDGQAAAESALAAEVWMGLSPTGYGTRRAESSDGGIDLLVGAARVSPPADGWSVVFVEPTIEALAPVRAIRDRWMLILAGILFAGLGVAALLARQVLRPLDDVTRATSAIAAHPDRELPLLPVRSRNEVGQLTESFNTMTIELQRSHAEALSAAKFAFAGELAAMVAHEIRTPLSVLRSSAQMLANPTSLRAAAHNAELVATIVAEVDRVERVVTGLIQLARPLDQRVEPTQLRDLLERAQHFIAAQADRQHIRLTCDFTADTAPALCDGEQMYQVILNLVVNALQALPPGGSIRLQTLAMAADTVGFAVVDDGPGVPPEIRDQLFQPFVTGREDGTGLGLAFVDRIVKAHHGTTRMDSESGLGTSFTVTLPKATVGG